MSRYQRRVQQGTAHGTSIVIKYNKVFETFQSYASRLTWVSEVVQNESGEKIAKVRQEESDNSKVEGKF
jgi:hypothetical protein